MNQLSFQTNYHLEYSLKGNIILMLLYTDFDPTVYLFLMNGKVDEYLINIARLSLWHIGEIKNGLPLFMNYFGMYVIQSKNVSSGKRT